MSRRGGMGDIDYVGFIKFDECKIFRIHNFEAQHPLRRPDLSLEVDAPEDLALIEQIMQHFINTASYSLSEIIEFVDANKIHELNKNIPRRWKKYRLQ